MRKPSTLLSVTLLLSMALTATLAVEQSFKIYFNLPIGNGNINLYRKFESDIYVWQYYLDVAHAYCWTGWWQMFDSNGNLILNTMNSDDRANCDEGKGIIPRLHTGRFLGPNDTDTAAIAFYEGQPDKPGSHPLGGKEHLVEGLTSQEFPFENLATGFATFGHSNWTFYSGPNFTGTATCFRSQGVVDYVKLDDLSSPVQSVVQGCIL